MDRALQFFSLMMAILFTALPHATANNAPFYLRLESSHSNKILLDIPLNAGDKFYFHYIHSSDGTPVQDTFRIDEEGRMILIEEAFLWYGAGLEFQNHREAQLAYEEKWIKVRLNRPFPKLRIRVGKIAQQVLIIHNRWIYLEKIARPGEGLILSIAR